MMAFPTDEGDSFSSSTHKWVYDVFLSFRVEDTRHGFTSHLNQALRDRGFKTFIDNDLQRSEQISAELIKAIKSSMILIIIFSQNYAFSTWCLEELTEILECKKNGQKVLPVFYKVNPSEVRKQEGNFGIALTMHEKKFENKIEKVLRWRAALEEAANLSGWHYEDGVEWGKLWMHDLLQQMGEEIVQQESDVPGERTRLWRYDDALEVLTENTGSNKIRSIMLWPNRPETVTLAAYAFKRMINLKILIVNNVHICEELKFLPNGLRWLDWPNYPFPLPSNFCPQKLGALNMPYSRIQLEKLLKQGVQFQNLKCINVMECGSIARLPNLCAPNLEKLNLSCCRNLVECHESIGFLDKLKMLEIRSCKKLQNFPSHLMWKSLKYLDISSCSSLDVFSFLYQGKHWFEGLYHYCCKNVMDLADIIYKLQQVERLCIYTSKSRPWCGPTGFADFEAFLDLSNVGNLIDLDFLMKPDYFLVLEQLYLNEINIIIIPKRISKFTRLKMLEIKCCKYLQEIPRLPQSIRQVFIINSHSLHPQSSNRLFSQFGEFWYQEYEILQPRQNPMNNVQRYGLILPGSVIPKWFNHQSVGNSISFWIGRDFLTFVCCAVLEPKEQLCALYLQVFFKINGTKVGFGPSRSGRFGEMTCNHLWFFNVSCEFPGLNLYDQNHVEVVIANSSINIGALENNLFFIARCGVHVECVCPLVERFGEFEAKRQHQDQDQDHSTDTFPPTSMPAFPICSISNSVTQLTPSPSPTSDLELSNSYSMERTYNDFESLSTGFHVDGCNLSLSPYTSPMGRKYQPPQPQVIVLDQDQDHSDRTLPLFPTSYLELSNSNSMEATYNDFDSLLNGFHVDGCDLSMSLYTSPMGRNYQPPQPQVPVLDDTSHISLPSSMELLNNMTYKSELLGLLDLGIGSTVSEGFHLGSSSTAHNFFNDDDSDFNLYSPSKKMRTS